MQTTYEPALAPLEQSVEELALEVSLRDTGMGEDLASMMPMLDQIRVNAVSAGMDIIALIAATKPDTGPKLREAVTQMQQALAMREQPAASAQTTQQASLQQDPELVADFIIESREHLAGVEAQLLALEQNPQNADAINTIFRGFHTIKGIAGFLDFSAIQAFAHEVETLLDLARNSKLVINSALIDIILKSADHLSGCLEELEARVDSAGDSAPLISLIHAMIDGTDCRVLGSAQPESVAAESTRATAPIAATHEQAAGPRSVKVDTGKMDDLVEMVGELVIAQSLIQHDPDIASAHNARLTRNLAQLTRITADVQRVAMAMRMIPISQLFGRMSRLVRDLARKSGKQANLELTGEDTELDRSLVEELADPLMHMIRNAVDHATEPPEVRAAAGKSPIARLDLKAYHKGGFINIEVCDDGRGLGREKILAKAQQRGLVTGGEHLSDTEVFNFIFEPGFSTAEKITDVSGRGVGMDVVRQQITKLRGRIDIRSRSGEGTTFTIKLPLTMAIIEGLIVGVGEHRYIIPIFVVKEMFRPTKDLLSTVPNAGEMVLVRESLLPILRLHDRFGVIPSCKEAFEGVLIVVESARKNFCVLVDELIGKQEVVIKSLGETFENIAGVAGGSILGDGRVGLILDVEALFGNPTRE